ncbi:MAG: DsbC family protein [Zoogloeaceae bacterium]|jgi:thiol:disulfide interchange protein DsbC|nr:DsbC family protein [Zoogloeaceae bacterium]
MLKKLVLLALAVFAVPLGAQEAKIREVVEAKLGVPVVSVTKADYLGLYEVFYDGQILYTDEKASAFLVEGQLVDAKTMRNITAERIGKLTAINFAELSLERAIKQVRGNGKRILVTFEDPNCGYCKVLARDMQKLNNVTIYTFLYPILSEDSLKKSRQIWCAADRAKTWNKWMIDNVTPSGQGDCDSKALLENRDYGRKRNISGTPTLIFADGSRIFGAVPVSQIEQKLNSTR